MVDGFALGHSIIVAADAGRRRAFENATFVAGFAIHLNVRTFQRHARVAMIKILVNLESSVSGLLGGGRIGCEGENKPQARDKSHEHTQENFCSAVQQSIMFSTVCRPYQRFVSFIHKVFFIHNSVPTALALPP